MITSVKLLQKMAREVDREVSKQMDIIYPAVGIVLWEEFGWRADRIDKIFQGTNEVWQEQKMTNLSILRMLEDETGIELHLEGTDKSYHEYEFIEIEDGAKMSPEKLYLANVNLKKWVPTQLLASVMIVLHRKERFGFERLNRFMTALNKLRAEYGNKAKPYHDKIIELTGIRFMYVPKKVD